MPKIIQDEIKKPNYTFRSLVLLTSCSSVKVLDAWKGDNVNTIKDENILVIARASNQLARVSFEEEIAKQIRAAGLNATESHKQFPGHKPDGKASEEQVEQLKAKIQEAGFNGIAVSVVKDLQETTRVTEEGGYYTGGYYWRTVSLLLSRVLWRVLWILW